MAQLTGVILFFVMIGSMEILARKHASRYDESQTRNISLSNELFSVQLYKALLREEYQNLVYSPFSISSVMAMLSLGAEKKTLRQLKKVFFFPSSDKLQVQYKKLIPALRSTDDYTLDTANTIFMNKEFHISPVYKEKVRRTFHSNIHTLNFAHSERSAMRINRWVEEKTRDKIRNLISPSMLSSDTQLVLVNAIYFKSEWVKKFTETQKREFFVSPSKTVEVPMMMKKERVLYAKIKSSYSMIELPYKGDRIVMQVILPNRNRGMKGVEHNLEDIYKIWEKKKKKELVKIHLPKFKLETTLPLNKPLTYLGLKNLFSPRADFSGISKDGGLSISQVVQKAFIEVDEEGTTAAAATAVIAHTRSLSMSPSPIPFVADHPFVFQLRDKESGMLLFQGRVINPLE